jgi:hypothetical protein
VPRASGDAPPGSGADAGPGAADAAAGPDAVATVTMTFGERPEADFRDVTADTYLEQLRPHQTNGAASSIAIDALPLIVGLIRFDVAAIPADATVLSAEMEYYVSNPIESGEFEGYLLLEAWQEYEASWKERAAGVSWQGLGATAGSVDEEVIARFAPADIGFHTAPIAAAAVQTWVSDPASNHGMKWISTSPDGRGGNLRSRETTEPPRRPLLRVTYVR